MPGSDLSRIEEAARAELDPKFKARETAIGNGRTIIRSSANAIRSIHRGELDAARELMANAHELLAESTAALDGHRTSMSASSTTPPRNTPKPACTWRWLSAKSSRWPTSWE